jgi:branched-chain amino acid transport system substrate-binding protein
MIRCSIVTLFALIGLATSVFAQTPAGKVSIGILGDQAGVVADVGGRGSVLAARMAVADFGGTVLGKPIELRDADHQHKVDIASSIAREWFDLNGVDAIADLPNTGAVLALQEIARTRKKTLLVSGAASVEITGKACSPFTTHWTDDTFALANGTARVMVERGADSWFFLTADYSFGYDLERDAAATIKALGGSVLGSVKHPLSTNDFSSFLLQAQSSRAKVIGLASAGADTVNAIKQAKEFGIERSGQRLASHCMPSSPISTASDSRRPRASSSRRGSIGTKATAPGNGRSASLRRMAECRRANRLGVYASVLHYLKAVQAAGSTDAAAVNAGMRRIPVDRFGDTATIRADGRVVYDIGVYEVKTPGQSQGPWDYYRKIASVPAATSFRPIDATGCTLSQ